MSIFKKHPGKCIILNCTYKLSLISSPQLGYKALSNVFSDTEKPNLQIIAETITDIRRSKLPKPVILGNCGSFFENPLITKIQAEILQKTYPTIPQFTVGNKIKTSAGWLIENAGLCGYRIGNIGIYEKHALVLVNYGGGLREDLLCCIKIIQEKVYHQYSINIMPEPTIR